MLSLTFYGGVKEIGGNKVLVDNGSSRLFLDFGKSYTRMGDFYEEFLQPRTNNALRDLLGLDVIPKLHGVYRSDFLELDGIDERLEQIGCSDSSLWKTGLRNYDQELALSGRPRLDGVLISHAHLDHSGDICLLDERIPIYCSPITRALIEISQDVARGGFQYEFLNLGKKRIGALSSGYFPGEVTLRSDEVAREVRVIESGQVTIGSFQVAALPVDHSVLGAQALVVTDSAGKRILYTGDLRFHGRRNDWSQSFRQAVQGLRPDVMIVEGTRVDDDEPDSEERVGEECEKLVRQANQAGVLVLVSFHYRDTTRYQTLKEVAERTGRTLVISSKLAYTINRLKDLPETNLNAVEQEPNVRVYLQRVNSMLYSRGDYTNTKYDLGYNVRWDSKDRATIDTRHHEKGARAYQVKENPSGYILHLDYFELNELIDLAPLQGALFIRAVSEPFDQEGELEEQRLSNWLRHFGLNPPDHKPRYVHASGHASGPELIEMVKEIKPKTLVPIHTENPNYFAEALRGAAIQVIVPQKNGTISLP